MQSKRKWTKKKRDYNKSSLKLLSAPNIIKKKQQQKKNIKLPTTPCFISFPFNSAFCLCLLVSLSFGA